MKRMIVMIGLVFASGLWAEASSAQTLKKVKDRGSLVCGVSQGLPGFSSPDDKGNWTGFDVDFCRAIAAAIFNDPAKVKFSPLSAKDRFEPLKTGDIDVLSRNTTWILSRDALFNFVGVSYYDGQGFMARKALKVNSALELNGASVCTQTGTTTELNLADYFRANNMRYEVIAFATADETVKAYETGRCDVLTTDVSQLYAEKLKLTNANDHVILPEIISKEPLGPVVRHGDDQWFDVVKWVHFAMLNAEELGVSSKTVDEALKSNMPEIRRLVGIEGNFGEQIGLTKDWVVRIVKHVGNYGETFERNVGTGSKLGISRGLNRLWTKGGIQYARRSGEDGTVGPTKVAVINNPRARAAFYQLVLLAALAWLAVEFVLNAKANLEAQGFASGIGFLGNTAGFGISQTLIPYSEADSYGRVFVVGLLNTLVVAGLGIVCATVLGLLIGIGRLAPNWLVARLCGGYVEIVRNLPLLFQILFWYLAVLGTLPLPRQSLALGWQPLVAAAADGMRWLENFLGGAGSLAEGLRALAAWIGPPDVYLNTRGLIVPRPVFGDGAHYIFTAFVAAVLGALLLRSWARRRQDATGARFPVAWAGFGLVVGMPLVATVALGVPVGLERPELRGFNFVGGVQVIPEFIALLIALSTYTAAFIAEVVRAGILAIPRGQTEAALALGLKRSQMLRLVIVPQALRVIIPPLTNQYLNLTKNSSLAIAIGYPDLFAVFAGTTLTQTHQAIEIIAITMAVYLAISLVTSVLMNAYNASVRITER